MPIPRKNEKKGDYISRCIAVRQKEHPNEKVEQSTAICYSMWREYKKKQANSKAKT